MWVVLPQVETKSTHKTMAVKSTLNVNLIFSCAIVVFGLSFLWGYNLGVLNQPKQFIIDFYNETYSSRYGREISDNELTLLWSLTTALFIPGGVIGSLIGGWLADVIGRKRTTLLSQVFTLIGVVLSCTCVVASSPEMLMIGRVLVGVNAGIGVCIGPMILSEISPCKYRGAFCTVHQLSMTAGIFISSVFGLPQLLGTENLWPYLILLEAIPVILSLAITPFLPDTPRYLMLIQHDEDAARRSLQFYRRSSSVSSELDEMASEGRQRFTTDPETSPSTAADGPGTAVEVAEPSYSVWRLLKDKDLRMPLMIACTLVIIQQFSGINAVTFYSRSIFENAGVPEMHIPYAVIGTNAVNLVMSIVPVPIIDLLGRRPLLLVPMLVIIGDFIALTICLVLQQTNPDVYAIGYISIVCIIIFVISFAVGLGPIPTFIGSEMFRQGPRPKALAVVGVVMWAAMFIIAIGFEPLQLAARQYTFIIFIILMIGFFLFTWFLVPETKNKSFEEIADQFSSRSRVRKSEMSTTNCVASHSDTTAMTVAT